MRNRIFKHIVLVVPLYIIIIPIKVIAQVNVAPGFTVEVFAAVEGPTSLVFAPPGSVFGSDLFVGSQAVGPSRETLDDHIFTVSPSGTVALFAILLPEADPLDVEFPPVGSSFGEFLYVSSNNRDGGRPFDRGGTIQRVDPAGNVTDFTPIGLPEGPGQPVGMAFGPGGLFGDELFVANSSFPPRDIIKVDPSGVVGIFVNDTKFNPSGLAPIDVEFAPGGAFGNDLYFTDLGESCNCVRIADATGNFTGPFVILPGRPSSLEFGPGGPFGNDLYVGVLEASGSSIFRVKADGTLSIFANGFVQIDFSDALEFSPDGTVLFVADRGGTIYKITQSNQPPVADAGPDQNNVECTSSSGSLVELDGSGSSDPDDDDLTYTWREGSTIIAGPTSSPTSQVTLALGSHTIELTVDDGNGETDTDEVVIKVVDTTPPVITVSVSPDELWSPNHKMVDITTTVNVNDICDPNASFVLLSITSNEPEEGPGKKHFPDIMDHDVGSADTEFQLRAERLGGGTGRIYTITYKASDASGNSANATATVKVPHNMSKQIAFDSPLSTPESYELLQNYPNPFNPETEIGFQIPEAGYVVLKIYSILGQKIRVLTEAYYEAGYHSLRWDARDNAGNPVPSGVYLYQLRAGEFSQVRKMSLMR